MNSNDSTDGPGPAVRIITATPGSGKSVSVFSSVRLRVARERRGLTCRELADLVELTPDAITKFEKARCAPSPDTVRNFVFKLNFPEGWFYASDFEMLDVSAPSFRARRSLSAKLRDKATRTGDIAASVISPVLHKAFVLPDISIPDLSEYSPDQAALMLRHEWRLGNGPIDNMVHLLESKGAEVYWMKEEARSLDAWSVWYGDKPFIILNEHTDAGCRARFDAAHELGHLVLHRHAGLVDGLQMEAEANRFAAFFLMPEEQFGDECPKYPILSQFFPLKKRWGVSIAAQIMHGRAVGVLSEWDVRRAFQEISSRGWRTQEPRELTVQRETSSLHKTIGELLKTKGVKGEDFARAFNLPPSELLEMVPALAKEVLPARPEPSTEEKPIIQMGHLRLVA